MPTPKEGETRREFMDRCVPLVLEEPDTKSPEHAVAKCSGIWRSNLNQETNIAVQHFQADRVLSGDWVTIFPMKVNGYFRDGRQYPADVETLSRMVENFEHRMERGLRQQIIPVNFEHDRLHGSVGSYRDIRLGESGVEAQFDLTPVGRTALADGRFSYFSVELYSKMRDRETGEVVEGPIIHGGAFTNYPFWGEETALFAVEEVLAEIKTLDEQVSNKETDMEELDFTTEERNILRRAAHWLSQVFGKEPEVFSPLIEDDGLKAEVDELRTQLATFASERETYRSQIEAMTETIESLRTELVEDAAADLHARVEEDLDGLTNLGFDKVAAVGHFAMLLNLNEEAYSAIYGMLKSANDLLAEGNAFTTQGGEGDGSPKSPMEEFNDRLAAYAEENGLTADPTKSEYLETLRKFSMSSEENSALYRAASGL